MPDGIRGDVFVFRVADPTDPTVSASPSGPRLSQQRVEQLAETEFRRLRPPAANQPDYSCVAEYVAKDRSWMVTYSRKDRLDSTRSLSARRR